LLLDQLPADAELVALADRSLPRAEAYAAHKGVAIDVVQDYRRLLDRKSIDVTFVLEKGPMGGGVFIGHRSITVCHLAGIARRLGWPLEWNPDTERFVSDIEADALLSRPRRAGFELPVV
jgi:hypothetical protein